MIKATVIADSVFDDTRLISMVTKAPKFLDAQIEKHRMMSSSGSSDRAIPFSTTSESDFYLPLDVRLNQPGMQGEEKLDDIKDFHLDLIDLFRHTVGVLGNWRHVHKQHLNRYLMGFTYQHKIITANYQQFRYFINLRKHKDADPSMQMLAQLMEEAISGSDPRYLQPGEWHLPFIKEEDRTIHDVRHVSAARSARVSFNNHDQSAPIIEKDIALAVWLASQLHMTPFEHQATPYNPNDCWWRTPGVTHQDVKGRIWSGNFCGWIQYRQLIQEHIPT